MTKLYKRVSLLPEGLLMTAGSSWTSPNLENYGNVTPMLHLLYGRADGVLTDGLEIFEDCVLVENSLKPNVWQATNSANSLSVPSVLGLGGVTFSASSSSIDISTSVPDLGTPLCFYPTPEATLPPEVSSSQFYYVAQRDEETGTFQISKTLGGPILTFSTSSTGLIASFPVSTVRGIAVCSDTGTNRVTLTITTGILQILDILAEVEG